MIFFILCLIKKMASSLCDISDDIDEAKLQNSRGTNWHETNMKTISNWICISAFQIEALDLCIKHYREIIRKSVFLGLVFSTAAGTLSVTRIGFTIDPFVSYIFNGLFTFMSFSIALVTGGIKIYQIQEKLEEFIKIKQEWILFGTTLASELQLPKKLRKDALYLIISNKSKYLDLIKIDNDIPDNIKNYVINRMEKISEERGYKLDSYEALKISDIIMETSYNERNRDYTLNEQKKSSRMDTFTKFRFEELENDLNQFKNSEKVNKIEQIEIDLNNLKNNKIDEMQNNKLDEMQKNIENLKNETDIFINNIKNHFLKKETSDEIIFGIDKIYEKNDIEN